MLRTLAAIAACLACACPANADFFTIDPGSYAFCYLGNLTYDGNAAIGYCTTDDPFQTPVTVWWTRAGGLTFEEIEGNFESGYLSESKDGSAKLIPGVGVERPNIGIVALPGYVAPQTSVRFSHDGDVAIGTSFDGRYSHIWVWNPLQQLYETPYPEIEAALASFGAISGNGQVIAGSTFSDQVIFDLGTRLPPDVTADGMVAMDDFDVLRNGLNDPVDPMRAPFLQGDLNHSEAVGLDDFILFREYWHSEVMAGVVPEPSTWILAILAVLFVLGVTLCPRPKSTAGR